MRITTLAFVLLFSYSGYSQDAYHLELVKKLKENYSIENPAFILTSDESQNLNNFSIYGGTTQKITDINNYEFKKANNVALTAPKVNTWEAGLNQKSKTAVKKGDILLVTFWAKRNNPDTEITLFVEHSTTYEKEIYANVLLTPDWTQYFLPITASADFPIGRLNVGMHVGNQVQDFDFGGYTILNYKNIYPINIFPSLFGDGNYEGSEASAPWRIKANEDIQKLRKAELNINVVDGSGNAVPGADVKIEMQSHAFPFGTAVVGCMVPGNSCYNPTYLDKLTNLDGKGHGFNAGVNENDLKWDAWEEGWVGTPQQITKAVKWYSDQGLKMRGHNVIWPGFQVMPKDIKTKSTDIPYVRNRITDRINTMMEEPTLTKYIDEWDVLNEIAQNRDLEGIFDKDQNFSTGREIYKEIFKKVRAKNPALKIYVNEYVVESGASSVLVNAYKSYLDELVSAEVPFDGIGFQCHIGPSPLSILKMKKILDEFYTRYGKPIKLTEYDISPNASPATQARYLEDLLTLGFSLPSVEGFYLWGFWDGAHWKGNAPIYNKDWTLKPSGQAFIDKIFKEWWTNDVAVTNEKGITKFSVFKGKHKITIKKDGAEKVEIIDVTENKNISLSLATSTSTEEFGKVKFTVNPNPSKNGIFTFSFPQPDGTLEIYNMVGQQIKKINITNLNLELELSDTTTSYLAKYSFGQYSKTQKIITIK
jgi:endo-1,4-beta-xylanase